MKHGFYCRMYGQDCFMESDAKNKTNNLAKDFIFSVQYKLGKNMIANDADIEHVKKSMRNATMELKTLKSGLQYIDICGENFGGYGCDPCENPFEKCVIV